MFKVNNRDTRTIINVIMMSLLLTLNIFGIFSSVSVIEFGPVGMNPSGYCSALIQGQHKKTDLRQHSS